MKRSENHKTKNIPRGDTGRHSKTLEGITQVGNTGTNWQTHQGSTQTKHTQCWLTNRTQVDAEKGREITQREELKSNTWHPRQVKTENDRITKNIIVTTSTVLCVYSTHHLTVCPSAMWSSAEMSRENSITVALCFLTKGHVFLTSIYTETFIGSGCFCFVAVLVLLYKRPTGLLSSVITVLC